MKIRHKMTTNILVKVDVAAIVKSMIGLVTFLVFVVWIR